MLPIRKIFRSLIDFSWRELHNRSIIDHISLTLIFVFAIDSNDQSNVMTNDTLHSMSAIPIIGWCSIVISAELPM